MLSTPGACYVAAYFGGFLGNLLASACLGIDAWWLGFPILSLCHVVPTVMLMRYIRFAIFSVRNGQQNNEMFLLKHFFCLGTNVKTYVADIFAVLFGVCWF